MRHGSQLDPPNRFETLHVIADFEHLGDEHPAANEPSRDVEFLDDSSRSIISKNDSPDIPFNYSVNPYRGCMHGCAYCYARNHHEFLGFNAGLDFETKIVVKRNAAELLREFLAKPSWKPEQIVFSGVTDCYQPAERHFRITRECIEVTRECNQPIGIITKNALVTRDIDLLQSMAADRLVSVCVSVTTLDPELARDMEPRTSTPAARLRAIEQLSNAGVPVMAMMAPIIPGLTDKEIPALLKATRDAGAMDAGYILLRLPMTVEPVFLEWLHRTRPLAAEKTESHIRQTRGGAINRSIFGSRMSGTGPIAEQIRSMFRLFRDRLGFERIPPLDSSKFVPPLPRDGQLRLF